MAFTSAHVCQAVQNGVLRGETAFVEGACFHKLTVNGGMQESELKAAHAGELAQRAQQIGELLAKVDEVRAVCKEEVQSLKAATEKLQGHHEQQVTKLEAEAERVRGQHGEDVRKLEAEAEMLRGQYKQELQAMKDKLEEMQVKTGEMQAQHEHAAEKLASQVEKLQKQEELSSILVKDMQKKLDEHEHTKAENEVPPRPAPMMGHDAGWRCCKTLRKKLFLDLACVVMITLLPGRWTEA